MSFALHGIGVPSRSVPNGKNLAKMTPMRVGDLSWLSSCISSLLEHAIAIFLFQSVGVASFSMHASAQGHARGTSKIYAGDFSHSTVAPPVW